MALIIGPSNSGKSLLVKRLIEGKKAVSLSYNNLPATLPTTGMGLQRIDLDKKKDISIREIGGEMAPIWPNYYNDTNSIIFVVDLGNAFQFSSALIQVIELLKFVSDKPEKRVLLVLNKSDLDTNGLFFNMMEEDLLKSTNKDSNRIQLTIVRTSCCDCSNLNVVRKWLLNCK